MKTPAQALSALAALCSRGEQAESDLREKLRKWEVSPADADRIIQRLKEENFLSDERYARAFVRDKFRFNGWGRIKIAHALRLKHIDSQWIEQAVNEEIETDAYHDTLVHLMQGKLRSLQSREPRAARAALLRFAASRGFESDLCYRCLDEVWRAHNLPDDEDAD